MTTFIIDAGNHITTLPTPGLAAEAVSTGAQSFGSQQELAKLPASWPSERLLAVWNSLSGPTPVKSFKHPKTAISLG